MFGSIRLTPVVALVMLAGAAATAGEKTTSAPSTLDSGRAVGEEIPSFYGRVVTGPLMNRSVCYVCRNGSRPVVMVFVRELNRPVGRVLRNIDRIVDRHRGDGLRSFGVWLSERPSQRDVSLVQTFAFNGHVEMPLSVVPGEIAHPNQQNVHTDAALTIVLYRNKTSVERLSLRSGELDDVENLRRVLKRVLHFAEGRGL